MHYHGDDGHSYSTMCHATSLGQGTCIALYIYFLRELYILVEAIFDTVKQNRAVDYNGTPVLHVRESQV